MKLPFPVSLEEELVDWIQQKSKKGRFRNRSHLVEEALNQFKKSFDQDPLEVKEEKSNDEVKQ